MEKDDLILTVSLVDADEHSIKLNPNPSSLIQEYELNYAVISIEYNPELFTDEVDVKIIHTDYISLIHHVVFDEKTNIPNPLAIMHGYIKDQCVDSQTSTIDISVDSIMNGSIQLYRGHQKIEPIRYILPEWLTDKSLLNEPFAIKKKGWTFSTVYLFAGYNDEELIFISTLSTHPYWQKLVIKPYELTQYSIRWIGDHIKHDTPEFHEKMYRTN